MITLQGFEATFQYWQMFLEGTVCTIALSLFTVLFGFIIALLITLMRRSRIAPLRWVSSAYVEILRATPMMVQIFIFYHVILVNVPFPDFKLFGFIAFKRFIPGVVALSLNSAAYLSEIIRSGIQSVDPGQAEAARSLGMTARQSFCSIIMPQAIKNILPAIANEFVTIIKESAICWTIGVQDIMAVVQAVRSATFSIGEPLIVAAAIYFCLTFPTSKLIEHFERKMSVGDKR